MKKASSVEAPILPADSGSPRSSAGIWLCVLASVMAIVVAYFFAFRAAHELQIKDVPLAPRGARP